ncbi:phosphatase 2C-like domain-containing protein [Hygrophoropsis aurantiaca]|uniref:Phosphatase 2C-like domain-containing protein n=1 Tax=Hygrophoropsis aurantiaca TaxID=72124 RepID=A0ACB8AMR8_9AGAM|nr:phosphatase 2C-like domain-containing protein [Hygrophoropsis aurantiaca]
MSRLAARKMRRTLPSINQRAHFPQQYSSISSEPLSRPYKFHIGVSWAGKPPDPKVKPLKHPRFAAESPIGRWRDEMLVRPKHAVNLAKSAGEDFFYIADMRNQSVGKLASQSCTIPNSSLFLSSPSGRALSPLIQGIAFGVADGVGGWIDSGVDPSLFSQTLMYHAHRYSQTSWAGEPEIDPTQEYEDREKVEGWEMTPFECLELAYHGVLRERFVVAGSSTACLIHLNSSSGKLRSANLGDSGFLIIRSSSIIYRSPSQTHFFNCPKQLTKFPSDSRKYARNYNIDYPSAADSYEMKLRDGDIVIAYTDGLSDNVFPSDLVAICSLVARSGGPEEQQVQVMADRMVQYAQSCMHDRKKASPFEKEAFREGLFYKGGKIDDVTVVTALVRETI